MKIFFRYLFLRLLQPFCIVLAACTIIWIMIDLYGNMDDFLEHKVKFSVILYFYSLQIPKMLVQVLPAAILFSTLFTVLNLNRRSELVALQAGGMAPILIFSPFFLFGAIWVAILAYDLSGPAATSEVTRERLLKQVKGQKAGRENMTILPYVDSVKNRVWYFQNIDISSGHATGVEILQRGTEGQDQIKYSANVADWNGEFWKLSGGVVKTIYGVNGLPQQQKNYQELDLTEYDTQPRQLSLIVSQPDQLTVSQLSQYINSSTQSQERLAAYRTEWWYRVLYPFTLMILLLFGLLQGTSTDRRGNAAGIFGAIIVLLVYTAVLNVFMAAGNNNRMPPFLAVIMTQVIFGAIGLYLLAVTNGWWWQLVEYIKHLRAEYLTDHPEEPAK